VPVSPAMSSGVSPAAGVGPPPGVRLGDHVAGRSGRRRDGFVRNGQQWAVEHARTDGSPNVRLTSPDHRPGAASVTLPAWYVRDHVELGYAVTAHRA